MTEELSLKQKTWAEAYVSEGFNAARASRKAGYSGSDLAMRVRGSENLSKPHIRAYIEQLTASHLMSAEETLMRLTEIARNSATDYLELVEGRVIYNIQQMISDGKQHLIKRFKQYEGQIIEVEFYNSQDALIKVASYHGLFADSVKVNDEVNKQLTAFVEKIESNLSPEIYQKVIEAVDKSLSTT